MNVARERLDALERRRRQDAVTEVEDVSRPPARPRQYVVGGVEYLVDGPEQQRRIEVALNPPAVADPVQGSVDRRPPAAPNTVPPAPRRPRQLPLGATAKAKVR